MRFFDAWNRFWFVRASARDLGRARALFFGGLLLFSFTWDFRGWGDVSFAFWYPTAFFRWTHIPIFSPAILGAIQVVWRVALAAAAAGFLTSLSTGISFVLGFYLLGLAHNFGQIQHEDVLTVFTLLTLAASRCGDAFSLDAALRRRDPPAPSGEYGWPIVLVRVMFTFLFFGAAVAKLRHSGIRWFTSDSLAHILVRHQYPVSSHFPWVSWGVELSRHRTACHVLAFLTIAIELLSPLALFFPAVRRVLIPLALLMLFSIRALMGPAFGQVLVCSVFWLPWSGLRPMARAAARKGRAREPGRAPPLVAESGRGSGAADVNALPS
ncbi:MAG: hypothetical protein ACRD16_11815 [Thermoanaerobaculia bacterium]